MFRHSAIVFKLQSRVSDLSPPLHSPHQAQNKHFLWRQEGLKSGEFSWGSVERADTQLAETKNTFSLLGT